MLGHNTIGNLYFLLFNLAQHHKYSIDTLESMLPFELEIYTTMLVQHLEQVKEQRKNGATNN